MFNAVDDPEDGAKVHTLTDSLVVFFKTRAPVEPATFVHRILADATEDPRRKRTRYTKRLSPMTVTGRASEEGLAKVAEEVLAPHFHQEPHVSRKVRSSHSLETVSSSTHIRQFAIRPTLRNHNVLKRDALIQQVAAAVGHGHKVDLKNYDLLILVEVYTVRTWRGRLTTLGTLPS